MRLDDAFDVLGAAVGHINSVSVEELADRVLVDDSKALFADVGLNCEVV